MAGNFFCRCILCNEYTVYKIVKIISTLILGSVINNYVVLYRDSYNPIHDGNHN